MKTITVTAKRQATLPVELCEELGIEPGDKLQLERRELEGETVWILRASSPDGLVLVWRRETVRGGQVAPLEGHREVYRLGHRPWRSPVSTRRSSSGC